MSSKVENQLAGSGQRPNWVDETVESIESDIERGNRWILQSGVEHHLKTCSTSLPAGDIESLLSRVKKYEHDHKIFTILSKSLHRCGVKEDFKEFLTSDTVDQKLKVEFLKQEVKHDVFLGDKIQQYGIKDKKDRIEIAKIGAASNPLMTSRNIQNFDIKDERARVGIAKIALSQRHVEVLHELKNYEITDEFARVELARFAAGKFGFGFSDYVQEFCIHEEKDRVEIAKIAARQDGEWVSKRIKNYEITDQKALIEIASLAIQQDAEGTSEHFKNFGIKDEKARITLAMAAGGCIHNCITEFEINDLHARIKIARNEAELNGVSFGANFKLYGIADQKIRVELARCLAHQGKLECNIRKFNIEDEQTRIEIAKISAKNNQRGISWAISYFHIKDSDVLFEIAKIAARFNGPDTVSNIKRYNLKGGKQLLDILFLAIATSEEAFTTMRYFPEVSYLRLIHLYKRLGWKRFHCNDALDKIQELEREEWPKLTLNETIKKVQDPHSKTQLVRWLAYTVGFSLYQNINREGMMWMQNSQCLEAIYDYREPQEKYHLSNRLIQIATSEEGRKIFDALISELPKHLLLPVMILTEFQMRKVEPELIVKIIDQIKKKGFRDPRKLRPVINALNHILNMEQLSTEDFAYILKLMNSNDIVKYAKLIDSIISFKGADTLKKSALEEESNDLSSILSALFRRQIPIKDIPDFFDHYEATFRSFRNPDALNIYASKLTTLPENTPREALARFVESVFEGTFKEERYIDSSHLVKVFNGREALLKEWKTGLVRPWVETNQKSSKDRVDFHKIMVQSVHHLDEELSSILIDFLMKTRKGILKEIGMELKTTKKGSRESHILLFQRYCIRLANPKLKVGEQKTELDEMSKHLGLITDQNCEFFNDIKAMKEGLRKKEDNRKGWTVVDTDDPQDLMLSGTEVLGSCQRVNGDPDYNKCLLGYILDGKNRMLAVKDQSGKIIARSIFRILWDQKNKTPVLFMERLYPLGCNNQYSEAIVSLAKERALSLGLPLLSKEGGNIYNGTVESLGSKAPFEYCDAGRGVTQGSYSIQYAKELYIFTPH